MSRPALRPHANRIVLAHGVWDVLHLGHVRHLEEAKRHGDWLVVSVTSDRYAAKAPGRPVFPASMRAEMLASLSCVDEVRITDHPTAEPAIRDLRPAVFVKGQDYAHGEGGINAEAALVEACGGEVIFTDGLTFSSSAIINRHLDFGDPATQAYLATARERGWSDAIPELIERAAAVKCLFIGETIIDEYEYVAPLGLASKEFALATKRTGRETFEGGVVAAASHAKSFCEAADVLTWRSIRKTRFVDHDKMRKLFEVHEHPVSDQADDDEMERAILSRVRDYDVVVVTDFGHGMMTRRLRKAVRTAKYLSVNTQSNSANHGFNLATKYPSADYVCIDAREAQLAIGENDHSPKEAAHIIVARNPDIARIVVTDGSRGCVVTGSPALSAILVPAFSPRVMDTMGAGDAFLAVTAPLMFCAGDDDVEMVAFIGNIVGAIKCQIVGHREAVDKNTVLRYAATLLK